MRQNGDSFLPFTHHASRITGVAMYTTLISANDLHSHLNSCVVIDCRFDLVDTQSGQRAYAAGHIPTARYAHLDADLSGPKSSQTGRHPLPDPSALARTF